MPVTVHCPKCNKALNAPDELIGKVAACPGCNTPFPVTVNIRGSAPSLLAPGKPVSATSAKPVSTTPANASVTIASVPTNLPPAPVSAAPQQLDPTDPRRSPGSSANKTGQAKAAPSGTGSEAPVFRGIPNTGNTASPSPRIQDPAAGSLGTIDSTMQAAVPVLPAKSQREASPARFIAAGATQTRINLGADGLLPELSLQEASQKESLDSRSRASNPLALVVVLALSFGASAVLLFLDTESRRAESRTQASARQELADYYTHPPHSHRPLEEYQKRLRKALQAHNQGKYADERRYYRQVLNMLRDERLQRGENAVTGLTGVRKGLGPPSDEHLESLLARLLSDN